MTFTIAVAGDVPTFGTASVVPQNYVEDTPVDLSLPAASQSNGTLSYRLGSPPALPAGLTYYAPGVTASGGGAIAGTPTAAKTRTTYTLTATDTADLPFTIAVAANTAPSFSAASKDYPGLLLQPALRLPAASSGNGVLSYSLAAPPALPRGLTYTRPTGAASGGTIAGTPTSEQAATTYTLTAHDADGDPSATDAATYTFTIETSAAAKVRSVRISLTGAEGDAAPFTTGETIAVVVDFTRSVVPAHGTTGIKLGVGGVEVTAWEDTPGEWKPERLQFLYVVQAADWDGDGIGIGARPFSIPQGSQGIVSTIGTFPHARSVAADLDIGSLAFTDDRRYTVNDAQPDFGSSSVPAQRYRKNVVIGTKVEGGTDLDYVQLPAATNGDRFTGTGDRRARATTGGRLAYTLTPTVPPGLTFDAATRRIRGTPITVSPTTTYTLTATDYDGDAATLRFPVTVSSGSTPTFGGAR